MVAFGRRHRVGLLAGLVLLVAAAVAGAYLVRYFRSYETTDDAQVDAHVSAIGARVDGTVLRVHVDENQAVAAGQLLVELDPRDFDVALARARAELAQAAAQLEAAAPQVPITNTATEVAVATTADEVEGVRAAIAAAERERDSAVARLREAETLHGRARADLERARELVAGQAIPRKLFDDQSAAAQTTAAAVQANRALVSAARKAVEQQRARFAQAQSRLDESTANAPRHLEVQMASLASRRAAFDAARATFERATLERSYAAIVAPFASLVGRRSVQVGERVQSGQALVALVPVDDVWVTANFKETQLRRLRSGQRARIYVDALDRSFGGWVESFGAATGARFSLLPPENATGNYVKVVQRLPVRLRFDRDPALAAALRPGMSVEPKVWVR